MLLNKIFLIFLLRISFALNWISNEDFEYLFASDDKVSFVNAETECVSKGAEALTLYTELEINFIKSNCSNCNFWLPFIRNGSNVFTGLTKNQILDTKLLQWGIGEPKNELCVEYNKGFLYTMNCNIVNGYACRRKFIPSIRVRKAIQNINGWNRKPSDPCVSYSELKDNRMRAPENKPPVEILCDFDMKTEWYRVKSPAGNRIPTICVKSPGCGTLEPIWMEGTLPSVDDGIVTRKACVSSETNCCEDSWDIQVKACGGYYVYYLRDTQICFRAYCIGKTKQECMDCDFGIFPTLTAQPSVMWNIRNAELVLVCDTNYKLISPSDIPYIFEVEWFADNEYFHKEMLEENRNKATLAEKYLFGKFGKTITCQVRGRFEGDFSPKKTSTGFFFGIKINNPGTSIVLKPGETGKISFKLMFPLVCPQGVHECSLQLFTGLDMTNAPPTCPNQVKIDEAVIKCPESDINKAFCGVIITNKNWDQNHEISIVATIHSQTTITKKLSLKLCTFDTVFPVWQHITTVVPIHITITAVNIVNNLCYSYNDPHMQTFDGQYWEHPYVGTYILYRNIKSQFEIQAYYTHCPGTTSVTCNCAIAIKSSDMLVTIDRCANGNMKPGGIPIRKAARIRAISLPTPRENQRTAIFRHEEGRRYEIHLPTGTYADVTQSYGSLININIRASTYDLFSTEGLCGTFNGNKADDFKLRDGSIACNPGLYCQKFSKDWEVSMHKGGLFVGHLDESIDTQRDIFCKCIMKDGKIPDKSCEHNNNIQVCQNVRNGQDISDQLLNIAAKQKRSTYHDYVDDNHLDANWAETYLNRRKKRAVEANDKIVKTWTTDTARKHCQESLKTSSAGKFCGTVPNVEFNSKVEFCILDIMASQSTSFVISAVEAVKEECTAELNRNTTLWVKKSDPTTGETIIIPPPEIEDNLCINDCSNHGTCNNSKCKCDKEFMGGDCSIKVGVPPEVYYIPQGGLCDKQGRPCASTVVYGLDFVHSDQLTCHFQMVTITMPNGGYHPQEENLSNAKASFESFGELRCPVPNTKDKDIASWIIYISNDGKLKSKDGALFTVYNSNCIICKPEGMCSLEANYCLIQNRCFKAGESNGEKNPCDKCKPEINVNQWTKEPACGSTPAPPPITFSKIKNPSTRFMCLTKSGLYTHPLRCSHYIECRNWQPFIISCGLAKYYNPASKSCVSHREVPKCIKGLWF